VTRIIHARGDVLGMFIFLTALLLGLWQVVVARKRLNGMSLTGHPDRKWVSYSLGAAVIAAACAWYFSAKNHFAAPDLEGIETLIVLVFALACSTLLQGIAAQVAALVRAVSSSRRSAAQPAPEGEPRKLAVGRDVVPATFLDASADSERGLPILLLHDYGGSQEDMSALAGFLAEHGHTTLAPDLDGHGESPRLIGDQAMEELLAAASEALASESGVESFAAVGVGLGGTLALRLATSGLAERAIAIDPPARDESGHHDVNSLREFAPGAIMRAFFKPAARADGGRRLSLSRLLATMPEASRAEHRGHSTTIATRAPWLNEPVSITEYASKYSPFPPVLITGSHSSLALEEGTLEFLAGTID